MGKKYKKTENGRKEMATDFSVTVDPYLRKQFNNNDEIQVMCSKEPHQHNNSTSK